MKKFLNLVLILAACLLMYRFYQSRLHSGAERWYGTKVVCEQCGKVIEDRTQMVRVPPSEAGQYTVTIEKRLCDECAKQARDAQQK